MNKKTLTLWMCTGWMGLFFSCTTQVKPLAEDKNNNQDSMQQIAKIPYGTLPNGLNVDLYTLRNKQGLEMGVINYGGIIVSLKTPDRSGTLEDIVLGFDSLSSYVSSNPFFGALVGRYGNRIAHGEFTLDGKKYSLVKNNGENHLHGGKVGFDKKFWKIQPHSSDIGPGLFLTYHSPDMEEGYPGNLDVEVTYVLSHDNELIITYKAVTDKRTVINLTQHTYFNLTGNVKRDILAHEMTLQADHFLAVDQGLIPVGKMVPVMGTPFDFKSPWPIGKRINEAHEQIKIGGGYDHCFVLNNPGTMRQVATVTEPMSGRVMEMSTTEPGVQFYTGNFLKGDLTGKGGVVYRHRFGFCLETQHYPDSPNRPDFPSVTLEPGKTYETSTVYRFLVKQ